MAQCGDKIIFYASQTEFWVDVVYYIMTDNRYLNTLALSSGISRGEDGLRNGAHVYGQQRTMNTATTTTTTTTRCKRVCPQIDGLAMTRVQGYFYLFHGQTRESTQYVSPSETFTPYLPSVRKCYGLRLTFCCGHKEGQRKEDRRYAMAPR